MRRPDRLGLRAGYLSVRLAAAASFMVLAPGTGLASKPVQRCTVMDAQLTAALKTHGGRQGERAAAIGSLARKLCGNARPALGLRYYMKAFRVLGVQPKLPED